MCSGAIAARVQVSGARDSDANARHAPPVSCHCQPVMHLSTALCTSRAPRPAPFFYARLLTATASPAMRHPILCVPVGLALPSIRRRLDRAAGQHRRVTGQAWRGHRVPGPPAQLRGHGGGAHGVPLRLHLRPQPCRRPVVGARVAHADAHLQGKGWHVWVPAARAAAPARPVSGCRRGCMWTRRQVNQHSAAGSGGSACSLNSTSVA